MKNLNNEDHKKIQNMAIDLVENPGSYVFVIGAGASASVGVPVSSELKECFTRGLSEEIMKNLNDKCIERHEPTYENLDEAAMEVLLPVYAEIVGGENPIENFLRGHLGGSKEKFPPLGYEILAHLVNLSLVKHVVSMNFDELLEAALDEEVGESNYMKVRGESEFVKLLDDEESGQNGEKISERTLLLKPHGTISLSATLKVELDKVFRFEKEKSRVLEKVFANKNVVFVGYSFLDPDLRKLFCSLYNAKRLERVYFVSNDRDFIEKNKNVRDLLLSQGKGRKLNGFICEESDEFFRELGHEIEETPEGKCLPKITRHEIRNFIFKEKKFEPTPENKLLVEILIFSLMVQGKFKTKVLLSYERIKYLSREVTGRRKAADSPNVYKVLKKLETAGIMCIQKDDSEGRIFDIGDERCYLTGSETQQERSKDKAVDDVIDKAIEKLPELLGNSKVKLKNGYLKSKMEELEEKFDYDLTTGLHPFEFSFKSPDHREDPIEFRREHIAIEILKAITEGIECYIIAETGEWLLRGEVGAELLKKEYVKIILSDFRKEPPNSLHRARAKEIYDKLMKKCGSGINVRLLDWDLNKHHGTFSLDKCIYFYKEGKPSVLQPVVLIDKEDTKRLLDLCRYLWEKAEP